MFKYCNNLFEKISVVFMGISIFALMGLGTYFIATVLNFGMLAGAITQCFIAYCLITYEAVYKRSIIDKYTHK